jgi:hypothetical protein
MQLCTVDIESMAGEKAPTLGPRGAKTEAEAAATAAATVGGGDEGTAEAAAHEAAAVAAAEEKAAAKAAAHEAEAVKGAEEKAAAEVAAHEAAAVKEAEEKAAAEAAAHEAAAVQQAVEKAAADAAAVAVAAAEAEANAAADEAKDELPNVEEHGILAAVGSVSCSGTDDAECVITEKQAPILEPECVEAAAEMVGLAGEEASEALVEVKGVLLDVVDRVVDEVDRLTMVDRSIMKAQTSTLAADGSGAYLQKQVNPAGAKLSLSHAKFVAKLHKQVESMAVQGFHHAVICARTRNAKRYSMARDGFDADLLDRYIHTRDDNVNLKRQLNVSAQKMTEMRTQLAIIARKLPVPIPAHIQHLLDAGQTSPTSENFSILVHENQQLKQTLAQNSQKEQDASRFIALRDENLELKKARSQCAQRVRTMSNKLARQRRTLAKVGEGQSVGAAAREVEVEDILARARARPSVSSLLEEREREIDGLKEENGALRTELRVLRRSMENQRVQHDVNIARFSQRIDTGAHQGNPEELQWQLEALRAELDASEGKVKQMADATANLRFKCDEELAKAEARASAMTVQLGADRRVAAALKQDKRALQARMENLDAELLEANARAMQAEQTTNSVIERANSGEAEQEAARWKESAEAARAQRVQMFAELSAAEALVAALQAEAAGAAVRTGSEHADAEESLRQHRLAAAVAMVGAQESLRSAEAEHTHTRGELDDARAEVERYRAEDAQRKLGADAPASARAPKLLDTIDWWSA